MEITEAFDAQPQNSVVSGYEGSWERSGRSPNAAALLGLLAIGMIYFNGQVILTLLAVGVKHLSGPVERSAAGNLFEQLVQTVKTYSGPIRVAVVVSQYLFMLLPTLWLVRRWHTANVREYTRLKRSSIAEIALAVLATVMIIPGITYLANECARYLDIPDTLSQITAELFTARSFPEFLWLVFVVAITPAVCEEVFFRGYVQRTCERTLQGKSVWLIGIAFGLFHMQPLGLISLSLLGIVFGYFYYRSQSLLPAMAAHFANNFIAVWLMYQSPKIEGIDLATTEQIPLAWVLITLPLGAGALWLYHRATTKTTSPAQKMN